MGNLKCTLNAFQQRLIIENVSSLVESEICVQTTWTRKKAHKQNFYSSLSQQHNLFNSLNIHEGRQSKRRMTHRDITSLYRYINGQKVFCIQRHS